MKVYFTPEQLRHNERLGFKAMFGIIDRNDPYIPNQVSVRPPEECSFKVCHETEFTLFKTLEHHFFWTFYYEYKKHGDLEQADAAAEASIQMDPLIVVTKQQHDVIIALMNIYSNALIVSINKRGSGRHLEENRNDAMQTCRDSIKWSDHKFTCEIGGVEHEGKLGLSFEELVAQQENEEKELLAQQKWEEKKQGVYDFLRKAFIGFAWTLFITLFFGTAYSVLGAKVAAAVKSIDFGPALLSANHHFEVVSKPESPNSTTMPIPAQSHVTLPDSEWTIINDWTTQTATVTERAPTFGVSAFASRMVRTGLNPFMVMYRSHETAQALRFLQDREKNLEAQLEQALAQLATAKDELAAAHAFAEGLCERQSAELVKTKTFHQAMQRLPRPFRIPVHGLTNVPHNCSKGSITNPSLGQPLFPSDSILSSSELAEDAETVIPPTIQELLDVVLEHESICFKSSIPANDTTNIASTISTSTSHKKDDSTGKAYSNKQKDKIVLG